jgi:hypothetical protein
MVLGSAFCPRATMRKASSGSGLWSALASATGAVSHVSISSGVVRTTGIAFGWIGATTTFGSVVRKAKRSLVAKRNGRSLFHRSATCSDVHRVLIIHIEFRCQPIGGAIKHNIRISAGRNPRLRPAHFLTGYFKRIGVIWV